MNSFNLSVSRGKGGQGGAQMSMKAMCRYLLQLLRFDLRINGTYRKCSCHIRRNGKAIACQWNPMPQQYDEFFKINNP